MHAMLVSRVAVNIHNHLVIESLKDAVTRVWDFLFIEKPACSLIGIAPEEINLVIYDLLEEDLEFSMDLTHLTGRTDIVYVKDSNSNSGQAGTLNRCAFWRCGGL